MEHKTLADLNPIFNPRAVAIIGASNREGNFGRIFAEGLLQMGFKRIYLVHLTETEVLGMRTYSKVLDIPSEIDMAVIVSPLASVREIVKECTDKGISGVVIFTSGFGERSNTEGKALEQELVEIAKRGQTRIVGPNCMGIYCPGSRLTFYPGLPRESGSVGMISHSGSLSVMLTQAAARCGIRFSKVISCGNESDLNAADFLEYLGQDPETEIIIAYLEAVKHGRRFFEISAEISKRKPIILWKGGITEQGAKAAASHTGALAIPNVIWRSVVTQAGIISASCAEEMLDYLQTFYYLSPPKGKRAAIISGPGGPAVATSDACVEFGLELSEFSEHTRSRLARLIPSVGTSINNPIDLGMASDLFPQWYAEAIRALSHDDAVDMLIIIGGNETPSFFDLLLDAVRAAGKPAAFVTGPYHGPQPGQLYPKSGLTIYSDGQRAAKALCKMWEHTFFKKRQ